MRCTERFTLLAHTKDTDRWPLNSLLDHELRTVSQRSLGARFSFVPDGRVHLLQELRWEDDWHFVVVLTECAERWRFTIRKFGIPFLHPRLGLTRL